MKLHTELGRLCLWLVISKRKKLRKTRKIFEHPRGDRSTQKATTFCRCVPIKRHLHKRFPVVVLFIIIIIHTRLCTRDQKTQLGSNYRIPGQFKNPNPNRAPTKSHAHGVRHTPQRLISRSHAQHLFSHASVLFCLPTIVVTPMQSHYANIIS